MTKDIKTELSGMTNKDYRWSFLQPIRILYHQLLSEAAPGMPLDGSFFTNFSKFIDEAGERGLTKDQIIAGLTKLQEDRGSLPVTEKGTFDYTDFNSALVRKSVESSVAVKSTLRTSPNYKEQILAKIAEYHPTEEADKFQKFAQELEDKIIARRLGSLSIGTILENIGSNLYNARKYAPNLPWTKTIPNALSLALIGSDLDPKEIKALRSALPPTVFTVKDYSEMSAPEKIKFLGIKKGSEIAKYLIANPALLDDADTKKRITAYVGKQIYVNIELPFTIADFKDRMNKDSSTGVESGVASREYEELGIDGASSVTSSPRAATPVVKDYSEMSAPEKIEFLGIKKDSEIANHLIANPKRLDDEVTKSKLMIYSQGIWGNVEPLFTVHEFETEMGHVLNPVVVDDKVSHKFVMTESRQEAKAKGSKWGGKTDLPFLENEQDRNILLSKLSKILEESGVEANEKGNYCFRKGSKEGTMSIEASSPLEGLKKNPDFIQLVGEYKDRGTAKDAPRTSVDGASVTGHGAQQGAAIIGRK